jgi:hypothetical protein
VFKSQGLAGAPDWRAFRLTGAVIAGMRGPPAAGTERDVPIADATARPGSAIAIKIGNLPINQPGRGSRGWARRAKGHRRARLRA